MRYATMAMSTMLLAAALAFAQAHAAGGRRPGGSRAAAGEGPTEVVQTAAQGMLGELDKNRDAYRRDPSKVSQLVDKYLLPHFDTECAARLVLGQHWRTATPEQRKRFVDAFYHSLLNNYGAALVDFTADRLKIFPTKVDAERQERATVRTEVKRRQRRPRLGELLPAQDARGLEGLGRGHRRHQLRQQLPHRLRRADRAAGN